jgi:hypothetical protein
MSGSETASRRRDVRGWVVGLALIACQGSKDQASPEAGSTPPTPGSANAAIEPPRTVVAADEREHGPASDAGAAGREREVSERIAGLVDAFPGAGADKYWSVVRTLAVGGAHWVVVQRDCDDPGCALRLVRFDGHGLPVADASGPGRPGGVQGQELPGSDSGTAWEPSEVQTLEVAALGGVPTIRVGYTSAGTPECGIGHERRRHLAHVRVADGALLWHAVVAAATVETVEECAAEVVERDTDGDGRSDVVLETTCKRRICEDPQVLAEPEDVKTYGCAGYRARKLEVRYLQGSDGVYSLRKGDRALGRSVRRPKGCKDGPGR